MQERKLIVIPGFSPKNQAWIEETRDNLQDLATIELVYWPHWEAGNTTPNWIQEEVEKLHKLTENAPANVIAKSVGSLVMVTTLEVHPEAFNKIIICGLPLNDLGESDKTHYEVLKEIPAERILVIQNDQDDHGNFAQVREFLNSIECKHIEMISRPAADHNYPYYSDFREFLTK